MEEPQSNMKKPRRQWSTGKAFRFWAFQTECRTHQFSAFESYFGSTKDEQKSSSKQKAVLHYKQAFVL